MTGTASQPDIRYSSRAVSSRAHGTRDRVLPGTSALPPLAPERVAAARKRYGVAVDQYLEHLRLGDPAADELVLCFERMPPGEGSRLLVRALQEGIDAIDDPPEPLAALFEQIQTRFPKRSASHSKTKR